MPRVVLFMLRRQRKAIISLEHLCGNRVSYAGHKPNITGTTVPCYFGSSRNYCNFAEDSAHSVPRMLSLCLSAHAPSSETGSFLTWASPSLTHGPARNQQPRGADLAVWALSAHANLWKIMRARKSRRLSRFSGESVLWFNPGPSQHCCNSP